jgi:hypothetical protein
VGSDHQPTRAHIGPATAFDFCDLAGIQLRWATSADGMNLVVSMMSYQGVPVEEIARLAGHAGSRTTEVIYRVAPGDCDRGRSHGPDFPT